MNNCLSVAKYFDHSNNWADKILLNWTWKIYNYYGGVFPSPPSPDKSPPEETTTFGFLIFLLNLELEVYKI